ncbi:hypothetical protein FS837_001628 [Tulasnella sp. UAMH 9824]|nr:hypothetical protein FS837_001628 [Tulasnella sp. UAMH 9824]
MGDQGRANRDRNRLTEAERILQRALNLAFQPSSGQTSDASAHSGPVYYLRLDASRRIPRKTIVSACEGKFGPAPLHDMTRFLEKPASAAERGASNFAGMMWKEKGNELFKEGSYVEAREAYLNSIRLLLSQTKSYDPTTAPGSNSAVISLGEKELWAEFLDVVACANNIAQSYIKERNHLLGLEWLMEVHRMYDAFSIGKGGPNYKWNTVRIGIEEFTTTRMKAFLRQAIIFNELGNSAAVASAAWDAYVLVGNVHNDAILKLAGECHIENRLKKRHPDPEDISKITYNDADLQIRGVWNKLQVGKGTGHPGSRKGFASVLWKGMYYVFGGLHGTSKAHCDGWALNLRDLKQGWRQVPYPEINFVHSRDTLQLALHEDKAYLFIGEPNVHVFNLRNETWSTVRTTMKRGTPWTTVFPGNRLESYACVVSGNTIYYFGGSDGTNRLGRNAIVALDLTTLRWELVSGKVEVNDDPTLPGVREYPVMWMDQGKLWITLGNANRQAEWLRSGEENVGAPIDHSYQDLWSYDLKTKQWVDERSSGNPPCLRTEVEYTFNISWNRVIVHGGYCASLGFTGSSTWEGGTGFTYFGDTFAWNPETKRWSQVITRGFPTYRAAANLFTDEQTGRTYLFGGYTNTHYTPSSRDAIAQSFNDLWEMCIEVPGSNFKDSDFEVDERFSKLGPWKRCFTCGSEYGPSSSILWIGMPKERMERS